MIITGDHFANNTIIAIAVTDDAGGTDITYDNPSRRSYTELHCTYNVPGVENECQLKKVVVTVNSQESNAVQLCYGTPIFFGIPANEVTATEGGIYNYPSGLRPGRMPEGISVVEISSANPRCVVQPSSLSFSTSSWQTFQPVSIITTDDGAVSALGSTAYSCVIRHTLRGNPDIEMTLQVESRGCGNGEYLGPYARGNSGKDCICREGFFFPQDDDCETCPLLKSICNETGLKAPVVAPKWWRHDPTSPDLVENKFYTCPFPDACLGGNSTVGRCDEGHDGPVCATCIDGYVMQAGKCTSCPAAGESKGSINVLLLVLFIVALFLLTIAGYVYATTPALTKGDVTEARQALQSMPADDVFATEGSMTVDTFTEKISSRRTSLSVSQIKQLFTTIAQTETLSKEDYNAFIGKNIADTKQDIVVKGEAEHDMEAVANHIAEKASQSAKAVWKVVQQALLEAGAMHKQMQQEMKTFMDALKQEIQRAKDEATEEVQAAIITMETAVHRRLQEIHDAIHEVETSSFCNTQNHRAACTGRQETVAGALASTCDITIQSEIGSVQYQRSPS